MYRNDTTHTRSACIFLVAALRCSAASPAGQPCITLLVAAYLAPVAVLQCRAARHAGGSGGGGLCVRLGGCQRRAGQTCSACPPRSHTDTRACSPAARGARRSRHRPRALQPGTAALPPGVWRAATSKGLPGCPCSACPPRTHTGARQRPLPSRHWRYQPPTAQRSPPATSRSLPLRHHPCATARPAAGHAGAGRGRRAARGPQRQYQHAPRPAAGHAGAGCGRWPARKPWCHI